MHKLILAGMVTIAAMAAFALDAAEAPMSEQPPEQTEPSAEPPEQPPAPAESRPPGAPGDVKLPPPSRDMPKGKSRFEYYKEKCAHEADEQNLAGEQREEYLRSCVKA